MVLSLMCHPRPTISQPGCSLSWLKLCARDKNALLSKDLLAEKHHTSEVHTFRMYMWALRSRWPRAERESRN